MKTFNIWAEGFSATGQTGEANFIGFSEGMTFLEACNNFSLVNELFGKYYNVNNGVPTHWGCRLFDNEQDARKTFG